MLSELAELRRDVSRLTFEVRLETALAEIHNERREVNASLVREYSKSLQDELAAEVGAKTLLHLAQLDLGTKDRAATATDRLQLILHAFSETPTATTAEQLLTNTNL